MRKNTTHAYIRRLCVFKCYDRLPLLRYEENTTHAHNRRLGVFKCYDCVFKCYDHLPLLRYEKKILRMRTIEDCVFLNVTIAFHYYGMRKSTTHAIVVFSCFQIF